MQVEEQLERRLVVRRDPERPYHRAARGLVVAGLLRDPSRDGK